MNYGEYENDLMNKPFIPQGLMVLDEFGGQPIENIDNAGDYATTNA
jgi:hypothetical protein